MSDLEAPDPVAETAPPETPPAQAEVPPLDTPEPEPEGTTDVGGVKMVPAKALHDERREKASLKQKAEQYDQMIGYVNQVKPYIEFLQANPSLMTRTAEQTQPTPVTTTQPSDEKAEILAKTLDLYTAEGRPDVKRAQTILKTIDDSADAKAEERVRPLQESTLRERAAYNYQRALATPVPGGGRIDRQKLDALWSRAPIHQLATEEGATFILAAAAGFDVLTGHLKSAQQTTTQPLAPPLHTDAAGSRTPNQPAMTGLEERVAKLRGMTAKDYAAATKGFTPKQTNVLEDE